MQSYHPSLDLPQMLTHQTQILFTLIHMSHTSNPYPKNSSPHTQSNTKNPPHTPSNQTNHPKPTNSPFNNTKQHQHNTAQHQFNHQENNSTHPPNTQTKNSHYHTTRIQPQQQTQNPKHPYFSAIRLDRPSSQKSGGLLTYIYNNITYSQIPTPKNLITNNIELITTKIHLKHTDLHISNVYILPNTNNIDNSITNLFIHLTSLPNFILTSDFNAHSQTWHSPFTDHRGQLITSLILNQNTPTRLPFNPNQQPTSPDLITADTTISANLIWQTLKALNSDHLPILITFKNKYKLPTTKPLRTLTNYKKANWPQFIKHIKHTLKNTPLHDDPTQLTTSSQTPYSHQTE